MTARPPARRVVIVTGMSGAGRSTALRALEDGGYETVDNLPLSLLAAVVRGEGAADRPLALGLDIRTRDFGAAPLIEALDGLAASAPLDLKVLFLDSDDDILGRRYTETRRRHPLAADRPVADGIAHERRLVEGLRLRADRVIDTTRLTPGDLKRIVQADFDLGRGGLAVAVVSFSYRHGLPREADLVFDVRFLANPHYDPALRPLDGRDAAVAGFIAADPALPVFLAGVTGLLDALLPRYESEGKSYLTIAIGCTGGQHRSVYVAERLVEWLRQKGRRVNLVHRDLPGLNAAAGQRA